MRRRLIVLLAVAAVALCGWPSPAPAALARAPGGAPLVDGTGVPAPAQEVDQPDAGAQLDPLVSNGLGSPLCSQSPGLGELPAQGRRNCETSGFLAAPAPTENYGLDVHIDTGLFGFSSGGLLSTVQDLFVTPLWMALVWSVHALVVLLEWAFAIDLLDTPATQGIGASLRRAQEAFTQPSLVAVLAVASVLVAYKGLVRRHVVETAGEVLAMAVMMAGGLGVIADPTGTVGTLAAWTNEAGVGALAVAAGGPPSAGGHTLAQNLAGVFAQAIEAPWCYLEFGDVDWCRNPARLDTRLRAASLAIARGELARAGCPAQTQARAQSCGREAGGPSLRRSARLLREAQTNGSIFLALPANGPERNSINDSGSLLRILCEDAEATHCRGPTAAQAEFRTDGGTWPRVAGLMLIAGGVTGMLLLLGFIVVRLLTSALFSLLLLLLLPGMVLSPALGDPGRQAFRRWAAQLLGAIVSKLLFAFLLGAVLAVGAILGALTGLGWWTQWLLSACFWWSAYVRRHTILALAGGTARAGAHTDRPLARRLREGMEPPRQVLLALRGARERRLPAPQGTTPRRPRLTRSAARAPVGDRQAASLLEHDVRSAGALVRSPGADGRISVRREQLARLRTAREAALAAGDRRRELRLGRREQRVEADLRVAGERLDRARDTVRAHRWGARAGGSAWQQELLERRTDFLDAQSALASATVAARTRSTDRRDYAALAPLVGVSGEQYDRLAPGTRRVVRLQVDRELSARPAAAPRAQTTEPEGVARVRSSRSGDDRRSVPDPNDSPVMRDLREVAAGRKRHAGYGRP